jgi:two-component system phosphate regulon sensor histidine kinase PhoR
MARRRLLWQLFPSYLVVILLTVTAVTWYMARSMKDLYLAETAENLRARALLLEDRLSVADFTPASGQVDSLCKKLGADSDTRFTVILPSGLVIADSDQDPATMENHATRPEIKAALAGKQGTSTRYSSTLLEVMMYVALPVTEDERVIGVVRAALPVTAIEKTFGQIYPKIIIGGLVIILLSGLLSYYLSRRVSDPLERMRQVAMYFSKGEFDKRLPSGDALEINELASAMNQMAGELDDKIKAVVNQRNELDAVLSSMVEGVLTFDTDERLIDVNFAGSKILGIDRDKARGRYVQEIIRHTELQRLVHTILQNQQQYEDEIEIEGDGTRVLQMHGNILRNDKGQSLGVLVVLNDITRLRHLERVRRDFVSNVSHELRTPITSIKGFVETLREGAINNPEQAQRFLDIVAKHSDRLNSIIEDLLALSRIQEAETFETELEPSNLRSIFQTSIQACEVKARAKNISIDMECDNGLKAMVKAPLLELAMINLLDNAIKYSGQGTGVHITCAINGGEIEIGVSDEGPGIDRKHLPRLFERFYRVDRSRSREVGGTGLGLSIVKHIVQAHRGRVDVESTVGKGSTFKIFLPV